MPVISSFYGIEVAVPVSTIAQLLSNVSRVCMGWKNIDWISACRFLLLSVPLTALGAFGFAVVPKVPMTRVLCIALVIFAVMKLAGKMELPRKRATMIVGGGITGFVNGLLGISGPLSSAVFLTAGLAPVAYIATEATTATIMHVVKIVMYGKFSMLTPAMIPAGLLIGIAMMLGNYIALRTIKHINKKRYQKIVAAVMICVSIWLFMTV